MRILVTRPEPDGERTAAKLRARGCEVMLAPLLRVETVDADLDGIWHAVAVTSVNALRAIADHPALEALLESPAYAVGGRTADAALAQGFANVVSADGDVGDLAGVMKTHLHPGMRVLYLAGEERSGDLTAALAAAGIEVAARMVYRTLALPAFPPDVREALVAGWTEGVLHFSRRSAETYLGCAAAAGLTEPALAPVHFCLSQQVAEPLKAAGARAIRTADQPNEAALVGLIAG
ncbi:MAG TPA: uroporphyrinogen-III synthase [Xanthobacteraceae bacterium]|nr:uroporphyrinogen-III synthase [Xanthobacteraceae bacterium]